jgi:hypothetical protein
MKTTNLLHLFCFLSSPRQAYTCLALMCYLLEKNFSLAQGRGKADYECLRFLCGNNPE